MERDRDAFYVVRKGDTIGIYKSFPDSLAQVSDSSVSVFKGYGLPRAAEEYLVSHGISNAAYSVSANNVHSNLFGKLEACSIQPPAVNNDSSSKRFLETPTVHMSGLITLVDNSHSKYPRSDNTESGKAVPINALPVSRYYDGTSKRNPEPAGAGAVQYPLDGRMTSGLITVMENSKSKYPRSENSQSSRAVAINASPASLYFDGASKGNPGPSGAGAVLYSSDGRMVWRLCEGVGVATNNVAEYRGLLLGLKQALKKGLTDISVQGDSNLVCMQIMGTWKIKNKNLVNLGKEAIELKDMFRTFQIRHIPREFNAEADALANQAVQLRDGQVQETLITK